MIEVSTPPVASLALNGLGGNHSCRSSFSRRKLGTIDEIDLVGSNNISSSTPMRLRKSFDGSTKVMYNIPSVRGRFPASANSLYRLHQTITLNKTKGTTTTLVEAMRDVPDLQRIPEGETIKYYIEYYKDVYDHVIWIDGKSYGTTRSSFTQLAEKELFINCTDYDGMALWTDKELAHRVYSVLCQKRVLMVFEKGSMASDQLLGIRNFLPDMQPDWARPAVVIATSGDNV